MSQDRQDVPPVRERTKQLGAWFLGPKAENASIEEEMVLHVLRDYFHWRRNYYPSDEIIVTQQMRRESLDFSDALFQQLNEMLARLKRHFPFYSPRYIAHMLSDQTIPSVLGYFAGMLYNPNNVTPEAAPVTVEWELEVAADMLRLLGYRPPPATAHHRETRQEFGWAHLTSGGTVANLEALWVARNIRYFPLAARKLAATHGLPLSVKMPGEAGARARSLAALEEAECLGIKPNEATFLLPRLIDAVRQRWKLGDAEAAERTWELIRETGLSLAHSGPAEVFRGHPPVIFVSGAAHYCLTKAADLLGIGRDNLVLVDMDRHFRLEVRDLEDKLIKSLKEGRVPLAVAAIGGTTEEGAVDPLHRIHDFRTRLEREHHRSFWLHIDAAWTGYLRTLFVSESDPTGRGNTGAVAEAVHEFVCRTLELRRGNYKRVIELRWGSREVINAFLAFPKAESIVIDPHKMGYVPYPSGVVAFRNDRIRHFLTQQAPYISDTTSTEPAERVYKPPSTVGPYIVEGSKPGAAAAACWLSHRMIPPNREGYGEIMRASLLGARELYERLIHWEQSCRANRTATKYLFVPITVPPPDTNVVCFVVCEKESTSLRRMNRIGERVYERFTISTTLGERDYSYSQPFFLSRTRFQLPHYTRHSVEDLLERAGVDAQEYGREGIFVLRATVMSPYIVLTEESGHKQSYLSEFVETLAKVAAEAVESPGPAEGEAAG